jgi:hypothetical protein
MDKISLFTFVSDTKAIYAKKNCSKNFGGRHESKRYYDQRCGLY